MAEQLDLEVVTPERRMLHLRSPWVTLPGAQGEVGILPEHVPLLTVIDSGIMRWTEDGQERHAAVHHGYAEVERDRVTVVAEMVERREDINRERAQAAERRARQELRHMLDDDKAAAPRVDKYEAKLRRAVTRQTLAG